MAGEILYIVGGVGMNHGYMMVVVDASDGFTPGNL